MHAEYAQGITHSESRLSLVDIAGLYACNFERLVSIASRLTKDFHLAEDIVQEVFLVMLEHPSCLQGVVSPDAYIAQCMRRRALTELALVRLTWTALLRIRESRHLQTFDRDQTADLKFALAELSPCVRVLFYLRFWAGYSMEEVARAVGCNERTVRRRIARGLFRLRFRLGTAVFTALAIWSADGWSKFAFPGGPISEAALRDLFSTIGRVGRHEFALAAGGVTALLAMATLLTALVLGGGGSGLPAVAGGAATRTVTVPADAPAASIDEGPGATARDVIAAAVAPEGVTLRGWVRSWGNAAPLGDVAVRAADGTEARSSADGAFTLPKLPELPARITASCKGFVTSSVTLSRTFEGEVSVFLVPDIPLRVTAVDSETLRGLAGITVELTDDRGESLATGLSDEAGAVELRAREFTARAQGEGTAMSFLRLRLKGEGYEERAVYVGAESLGCDGPPSLVRLVREMERVLRLVDKHGAPVEGAIVAWKWELGLERLAQTRGHAQAYSGEDGEVILRMPTGAVSAWVAVVKARMAPGFVAMDVDRLRCEEPLSLSLGEGCTLAGRLVDAVGTPVPAKAVRVEAESESCLPLAGAAWIKRNLGRNFSDAHTDTQGRFALADMPAGRYRVFVEGVADALAPSLSLPSDAEWVGVVGTTGATRGLIVGQDGAGLPRATVLLTDGAGLAIPCDEEGRFTLPENLAFPANLLVMAPNHARAEVRIDAARQGLVVVLDRGGQSVERQVPALAFRVAIRGCLPASEPVMLTFSRVGSGENAVVTMPVREGILELCGVPAGRYDILLRMKGATPVERRDIVVPAVDPLEIDLEPIE